MTPLVCALSKVIFEVIFENEKAIFGMFKGYLTEMVAILIFRKLDLPLHL